MPRRLPSLAGFLTDCFECCINNAGYIFVFLSIIIAGFHKQNSTSMSGYRSQVMSLNSEFNTTFSNGPPIYKMSE